MAFYVGGGGRRGGGGSFDAPARNRPISTRWTPGQPYYMTAQGTVHYLPKDTTPYQPGSAAARALGSSRAVPPLGSMRQPGTPNPYGITPGTLSQQNQGVFLPEFEGQEYLGGFPDDYASGARVSIPYGSDNLSLRYHAYQERPPTKLAYGRPIYREGMQVQIASGFSVDEIRGWQAFFQANGFKTGPAGFWTEFEANAMRAFMTMANGVPGGGMDVFVLRDRVISDVNSGAIRPGELAGMLGVPATGQNELAPGGGAGAGAVGDELAPYTETTTHREIQQFSTDQGMMLLRSELAQQIGRRPTEGEVARYIKGLNSAFRADPAVVTTVVRTDPGAGTVDTETTREESGVDPQARAAEFGIEGVPQAEREGYQANRYLDALMAELGMGG